MQDKTIVCKDCNQEFVFTRRRTGILQRKRSAKRAAALCRLP